MPRKVPVQLLTGGDYDESPSHDAEIGTGLATCRFCGKKIAKGDASVAFYPAPGGGCRWEAITAHAHLSCVRDLGLEMPRGSSKSYPDPASPVDPRD